MEIIPIYIVVEGDLDETILRHIIEKYRKDLRVEVCLGKQGSGYIKNKILGFNRSAEGIPFIILTDLDTSPCAPYLVKKWLPHGNHKNLLLRVAVTEVESWILADRVNFSRFLKLDISSFPSNTDHLKKPKEHLISLARKSPVTELRKGLVPVENGTALVGPDYSGVLIRFISKHWSPEAARKLSPSLDRAISAIRSYKPKIQPGV